jgi:hypothetical protein
MEIVHAHIVVKLNTPTMDFQQQKEVGNALQHKEPSFPKRPIVKELICGKVVGCQKSLKLEKCKQFPFSLTFVFHSGFL